MRRNLATCRRAVVDEGRRQRWARVRGRIGELERGGQAVAGALCDCQVQTERVSPSRHAERLRLPPHAVRNLLHANQGLHGVEQVAFTGAPLLRIIKTDGAQWTVMQVQRSPSSTTLHGAPEELLDTATSSASISMRPRFSSQCEDPCPPSFRFHRCALLVRWCQPCLHAARSPSSIEAASC
jgi:hypothetical protein